MDTIVKSNVKICKEEEKDTDKLRVMICEKIKYLLACSIDNYTSNDDDLKVAQTIQALSDAYKNLEANSNNTMGSIRAKEEKASENTN